MQSSPLYTSCLFSISLNAHIVDIEYLNVLIYFCYRRFFRIIFASIFVFNQRFEICINNRWYLIRLSVLIKLQYLSVFGRDYKYVYIYIYILKYFYQTFPSHLFLMRCLFFSNYIYL